MKKSLHFSAKAILLACSLLFRVLSSMAQPCPEEIHFENTNLMNCDRVVFQIVEDGQIPPPNISSVHVDMASVSGFTYSNTTYDIGTGELEFFDVIVTSYEKWGVFSARIDDFDCEITGKIVECCQEIDPPYLLVVDEDINDQTAAVNFNMPVIFMGDVGFDPGTYTFDHCDIYLGPDAELLPKVDAQLSFLTSNLQPFCDCRWDRINLAHITNEIIMDKCTVRGALRGVHATTAAPTALTSTKFLDNFISLYVENSTGTGSFNGSYYKVDDCTFDLLGDPMSVYCYDDGQSAVNMTAISATTCQSYFVTDVIVNNGSDNVHIGHENYGENHFKNTASNDKKNISINNSQCFVRHNRFEQANYNVCAQNSSKAYVGGSIPQMNIFYGSTMQMLNSSSIVNSNSFDGGYFISTNPTNTKVTSASPNGNELSYNDFDETDILIDGDNSNVLYRVYDNYIYSSPVTIKEMSSTTSDRAIFHSNYVENNSSNKLVEINDCDNITFANNHLEQLANYGIMDDANYYHGVEWTETKDAEVSNNYLENCTRGFVINGDNTGSGDGTQFTCNEFVNCYYPFFLDNNVQLLDQGTSAAATDNCYQYFYSTSLYPTFPYGEQISGTYSGLSSINWYMQTTTNCNVSNNCFCTTSSASPSGKVLLSTAGASTCTIPSSNKSAYPTNDESTTEEVKIHPNPVSSELTLEFPQATEVFIYSLQGKLMYQEKVNLATTIDVRAWNNGVYIVHSANYNGKFVVRN